MSIENNYYAEYNLIKPESKSWFKKAVDSVCKGFNDAINKVVDATRIAKNNPGLITAAAITAAAPNFAGCGDRFHAELLDGGRDATVQSDRPLDDGSFDGGDSTVVNPDAGDAQPTDAEPDAQADAGSDATTPDAQADAGSDATTPDAEVPDCTTDCTNPLCTNQPCGAECICGADGLKHQTVCTLGADGDQDGWEGCLDLDCQTDTRCTAFTINCGPIPPGNMCSLGGGDTGFCSEYNICVDG